MLNELHSLRSQRLHPAIHRPQNVDGQAHLQGREIDIVPCTWTRDIKTDEEGRRTVIVYYPTEKKRIGKAANPKPFVVAIMEAKNWQTRPLSFKRFVTLYEVRANGRVLGPHSIEADILRSVS